MFSFQRHYDDHHSILRAKGNKMYKKKQIFRMNGTFASFRSKNITNNVATLFTENSKLGYFPTRVIDEWGSEKWNSKIRAKRVFRLEMAKQCIVGIEYRMSRATGTNSEMVEDRTGLNSSIYTYSVRMWWHSKDFKVTSIFWRSAWKIDWNRKLWLCLWTNFLQ